MKKLLIAMVACVVLVGCNDKGGDFVGQWKTDHEIGETMTVTKVDGGYRVESVMSNRDMNFLDLEAKLIAESDTLLIRDSNKNKALELADGRITSYLRSGVKTFTKIN